MAAPRGHAADFSKSGSGKSNVQGKNATPLKLLLGSKNLREIQMFAKDFVIKLEEEIWSLPDDFYSSFNFTETGKNFTHPYTLGIITKILNDFDSSGIVAIDIRINLPGIKFQPDIALCDKDFSPKLFIDYESPNSSDSRIPRKDVKPYSLWRKNQKSIAPYFIITTLPNKKSSSWQLRYATKNNTNEEFTGDLANPTRVKIRENPFRFWYRYYAKNIAQEDLEGISLINIDCKKVKLVNMKDIN